MDRAILEAVAWADVIVATAWRVLKYLSIGALVAWIVLRLKIRRDKP